MEKEYKAHLLACLEENGNISVGTTNSYEVSLKRNKSTKQTDWETIALHMKRWNEKLFNFLLEEHTKEKQGARVFRVKEVK